MTAPLDPSLLAWLQGIAYKVPRRRPPKPSTALAERKREAREGRERTAAWLRQYLGNGEWHEVNAIRAASKVAGIRNKWLYEAMKELCVLHNRGPAGCFYRLRVEGDGA